MSFLLAAADRQMGILETDDKEEKREKNDTGELHAKETEAWTEGKGSRVTLGVRSARWNRVPSIGRRRNELYYTHGCCTVSRSPIVSVEKMGQSYRYDFRRTTNECFDEIVGKISTNIPKCFRYSEKFITLLAKVSRETWLILGLERKETNVCTELATIR